MKQLIILMVCLLAITGSASAQVFSDMSDIITGDSTPKVPFMVTGNNSVYMCDIIISGSSYGWGAAQNNTLTYIEVIRPLTEGDCTYNISTEVGIPAVTVYSPTYNLTYDSNYPYPETTSLTILTENAKTAFSLSSILILTFIVIALLVALFSLASGASLPENFFATVVIGMVVIVIVLYVGIKIIECISMVAA